MVSDNIEIVAKLKLDTEEAESKLSKMSKGSTGGEVELQLPKNTEIKLPEKTKKSLSNLFKDPGGLEGVSKLAAGATKGVGGFLKSLKDVAGAAGAAVGPLMAVAAAVTTVMKLLQGTDTMRAMQASLKMMTKAFRDVLAPVLALVGEVVIVLAESFASLAPILEIGVNALTPLLNMIVGVLKILQPFLELIGKIGEVFGALSSVFSDIAGGVITSLVEIIVVLIDTALKPLFQMLDAFIKFIDGIKVAIQDFITKLTFGLVKFNKTSLASTEAVEADLKSSLDTWETSGTETATERSARLAAEAANSAKEAAEGFSWNISAFLDDLRKGLSSIFDNIGKFFGNVWEGVKKWGSDAWSSITKFGSDTWNSISKLSSETWGSITKVASDAWSTVTNAVGSAWNSITSKAGSILGNVLDGIRAGVDILDTTVDKAKKVASSIGDTVSGWASSAASKVSSFVGKLKFWKDGGTLGQGAQLWAMNEKGNPEFIFQGGGHDTVINADILTNAMYNALMKADVGKTQRLEVSIKDGVAAGPRELAQILLPSLQFLIKR